MSLPPPGYEGFWKERACAQILAPLPLLLFSLIVFCFLLFSPPDSAGAALAPLPSVKGPSPIPRCLLLLQLVLRGIPALLGGSR